MINGIGSSNSVSNPDTTGNVPSIARPIGPVPSVLKTGHRPSLVISLLSKLYEIIIDFFVTIFRRPVSIPVPSYPIDSFEPVQQPEQADVKPQEAPIPPSIKQEEEHKINLPEAPIAPIEPIVSNIPLPKKEEKKAEIKLTNQEHYAQLEPTPEQKKALQDVFQLIAQMKYLTQYSKIQEAQKKLKDLHPFKSLKEILTNKTTRNHIETMRKSLISRPWNEFLKSTGESLDKSSESLIPFLPEFAKEIGCQPTILETLIKQKDWRNLILKLLEIKPVSV